MILFVSLEIESPSQFHLMSIARTGRAARGHGQISYTI